jgi:hypothetical protein
MSLTSFTGYSAALIGVSDATRDRVKRPPVSASRFATSLRPPRLA